MEGLSPLHLVLVLAVALVVLGPGKLPEVGAALGKSVREFRAAMTDVPAPPLREVPPSPAAASDTGAPPPIAREMAEPDRVPPVGES